METPPYWLAAKFLLFSTTGRRIRASNRQGPPYSKVGKLGANPFFRIERQSSRKRRGLEAEAGIEPTYKDLQSSA